jgi:hypothetical protein
MLINCCARNDTQIIAGIEIPFCEFTLMDMATNTMIMLICNKSSETARAAVVY